MNRPSPRSGLLALAPLMMAVLVACQGFFVDAKLSTIQLAPQNGAVAVGSTIQLTATGVNNDGTVGTLGPVAFSSSDQQVATVSSTGVVTGVSAGTATITATSGGVTGTTTVVVGGSGSSGGVTITPANQTVSVTAGSVQFSASDGTNDITASCTWTSSSTAVAQFSLLTPGLATLAGQGTTTVTATCNSGTSTTTATTTMTVGP